MSANLKRRLSAMDAAFLYAEREEQPMHIGAVCIFDGHLPYKQFARNTESRIHLVPRYRQKVHFAPFNLGHPTWEDEPNFDIENHIFRHKLPKPGGEAELREAAEEILTGTLDRSKPLWEAHLIEGLAGGRSALVFKVHHCMVDGVSGIGLAYVIFDMVPESPKMRKPRFKPEPAPEPAQLLQDAIVDSAKESIEHWARFQKKLINYGRDSELGTVALGVKKFATTMANFLLPFTKLPFNVPLSGKRRIHWSEFSFADARAIRAVCGGTVNDVALAVISGAVRRYVEQHGDVKKMPRYMRILAPVNVREEHEYGDLGNKISFLPIEIPLYLEDPVERLQSIHIFTREMKETKVAEAVGLMFDVVMGSPAPLYAAGLGAISTPIMQQLIGTFTAIPPANMICTNVPGPQIPLYTCGRRLVSMYPQLPVVMEMGINFAITSYDQKFYLVISGDGQAGPDVDAIGGFIREAFDELRSVAAVKEAQYVKITREAETAPVNEFMQRAQAAHAANKDGHHKPGPKPQKKKIALRKVNAIRHSNNGSGAHAKKPPAKTTAKAETE